MTLSEMIVREERAKRRTNVLAAVALAIFGLSVAGAFVILHLNGFTL